MGYSFILLCRAYCTYHWLSHALHISSMKNTSWWAVFLYNKGIKTPCQCQCIGYWNLFFFPPYLPKVNNLVPGSKYFWRNISEVWRKIFRAISRSFLWDIKREVSMKKLHFKLRVVWDAAYVNRKFNADSTSLVPCENIRLSFLHAVHPLKFQNRRKN